MVRTNASKLKASNRPPIIVMGIVVGLQHTLVTDEGRGTPVSGDERARGSSEDVARSKTRSPALGTGRLSAAGRDCFPIMHGRRRPRAERVEVPVFRCRLPLKRG